MPYPTTPIYPLLLLLVGVSVSRHLGDAEMLQPIVSRSQRHKICAELCMAGLGGQPCGDECVDLVPQDMPVQYKQENATESYGMNTRHDSCEVLCDNNLGYPLCGCNYDSSKATDFITVCSFYCLQYNYQIFGCQKCSIYNSSNDAFSFQSMNTDVPRKVDWDLWCVKKCMKNDGGAACDCDLLPMSLHITGE
ncbi:hypothetical protein JTB14_014392 [Gonioctena quinquepunctata]|nr:hypothetical protein JTB14_014392 [Gonioctena quinquepunctata]